MPPPAPLPIPRPVDLKKSAKLYLESHGLVARTPPLRSSNVATCLGDPFRFYLAHRLGIVPIWSWSSALSTGTWFHKRAEIFWTAPPDGSLPPESEAALRDALTLRHQEIIEICQHLGKSTEFRRQSCDDETEAFDLALATFHCAIHKLPIPNHPQRYTVTQLFRPPAYTFVCAEQIFKYKPSDWTRGDPEIMAQPDAIIIDSNGVLWLIDWKTCAESPTLRLQTCTVEQQTLQYLDVIQHALAANDPRLPRGARLGGIIHIACQKPTIKFGSNDRDFTIATRIMKGGPDKGQERTERTYHGEPRFSNYLERVTRWMNGTGEYLDQAPSRVSDPVINISTVHHRAIDDMRWARYHKRLEFARHYATCDSWPINFPDNPSALRMLGGKLSPYLPFYTEPVYKWPSIVADNGFIIAHRDENTDTPHDDNDDPADLIPG